MSRDIFLNIDTIVLHGLGNVDRQAMADALQLALRKQLASDQTLTAVELSRVRTSITLAEGFCAAQLGQALGKSLSTILAEIAAAEKPVPEIPEGGPRHA